ncbi:MAG: hypothetical protein NC218_12230 [Acetobacter sp.]|nr:hypothetical protein [Acetobacter sp.]
MKRKGLWITLGAVAAVIGVFVILCFTLFGLKTIKVDFRTSTLNLTGQEEQIVESGKFVRGGSVLFMGKKSAIEKIEKAHPYIKVVNIETVFPSTYVIHAAERLEVYAIPVEGGTLIVDDEFKVLRHEEGEYQSGADKPILYNGLTIANPEAEPGQFLKVENNIDIYSAFLESNRLLNAQKSLIKAMEVGMLHDDNINADQQYIKLSLYDGQTYLIKNATYGLKYKVAKLISVYSNIFSIVGQPIDDTDPSAGVWTIELIKNSTIEISNYYRSDIYSENECYFVVKPPQTASNV